MIKPTFQVFPMPTIPIHYHSNPCLPFQPTYPPAYHSNTRNPLPTIPTHFSFCLPFQPTSPLPIIPTHFSPAYHSDLILPCLPFQPTSPPSLLSISLQYVTNLVNRSCSSIENSSAKLHSNDKKIQKIKKR